MKKECFKCHKVKPIEEFYKQDRMADGHLNKCKQCTKEDVTANRNSNLLYYLEYDKRRNNLPHRVKARDEYLKGKGRPFADKAKRKWADRNPRKRAAEILFRNRQRYDDSLSPLPCTVCGESKVHAHHENYDEPLKVVWLCPKHHSGRHKEMRELGIIP